jgi:hypothetical protein
MMVPRLDKTFPTNDCSHLMIFVDHSGKSRYRDSRHGLKSRIIF